MRPAASNVAKRPDPIIASVKDIELLAVAVEQVV